MKMNLTPISSDHFTYNELTKLFVTEISDLGPGFRLQTIYDDAADVGFSMVSSRTGQVVTFYLENEFRNDDGDIQGWKFSLLPEDMKKHGLYGIRATIFND